MRATLRTLAVALACCVLAVACQQPAHGLAVETTGVSGPPAACHPEDYFPDRKVKPAFYQGLENPEFLRFRQCLYDAIPEGSEGPRMAVLSDFPKVGTCYPSTVKERYFPDGEPRQRDRINPSALNLDNGIALWDPEPLAAIRRSRVGDAVDVCVVELPKNCSADDLRGILFEAHNLRTGDRWRMFNTNHLCGGA